MIYAVIIKLKYLSVSYNANLGDIKFERNTFYGEIEYPENGVGIVKRIIFEDINKVRISRK